MNNSCCLGPAVREVPVRFPFIAFDRRLCPCTFMSFQGLSRSFRLFSKVVLYEGSPSEEILSVKREKRKSERIWRKTKLTVHLEIFRALCLKLKTLIHVAKEKCFKKQISDCGGDQKQLFGIVNSILGRGKQIVYPRHTDSLTLASLFNNYFITKIADIRKEFPGLELDAAQMSTPDFNVHNSHATLSDFTPTTNDEVQQLLSRMNNTTCKLDPFCTAIIMQHSPYFIHV